MATLLFLLALLSKICLKLPLQNPVWHFHAIEVMYWSWRVNLNMDLVMHTKCWIQVCAAKAIFYCPSMNSHRPRSQNIPKERTSNPEKDSTRKRPRSHVSLEKSSWSRSMSVLSTYGWTAVVNYAMRTDYRKGRPNDYWLLCISKLRYRYWMQMCPVPRLPRVGKWPGGGPGLLKDFFTQPRPFPLLRNWWRHRGRTLSLVTETSVVSRWNWYGHRLRT